MEYSYIYALDSIIVNAPVHFRPYSKGITILQINPNSKDLNKFMKSSSASLLTIDEEVDE